MHLRQLAPSGQKRAWIEMSILMHKYGRFYPDPAEPANYDWEDWPLPFNLNWRLARGVAEAILRIGFDRRESGENDLVAGKRKDWRPLERGGRGLGELSSYRQAARTDEVARAAFIADLAGLEDG